MPALAMTDHGNVFGAYDFCQGHQAGIKPIIGMEAYVAPEHRRHRQPVRWGTPRPGDDDVSGAGAYTHMTLLAESTEGMHNLFRLSSLASLEGYFRKPRIDRELLAAHARGLIATTGCPSGEVQTRLRLGHYAAGARGGRRRTATSSARATSSSSSWTTGSSIEQRVRDGLLRIAKELGLPFVATNDPHYTLAADAKAHEVLLCVQTGPNMADPGRFRFDGAGYYLKSPQEMRARCADEDWQAGCDNTLLIAERCDVTFREPQPDAAVPRARGGDRGELAAPRKSGAGWTAATPTASTTARRQQAEYEIGIITQMGFRWLLPGRRRLHHLGQAQRDPGRAGPRLGRRLPIVAYALGITDLDPLKHGLIFERFLNPERVSMPDIDIDFDERRRGDVIRYVTEKYGDDRVAQIITYGTIKAKAAVKDSARVLGYPFALGDRITKAMPPAVMGKDIPLDGDLRRLDHPRYGEAGRVPRPLRGRRRGAGRSSTPPAGSRG